MQILLLGPVELRARDGSAVHIGGARRRAVLAALAMEVNRVVPVERLLDMVWDEAPPPSAKAVLQGHVASLRGLFDDSVRLITREPGYLLQADPEQIDAHRQDGLLARAQAEEDRAAVPLLRRALGEWRGPALADCGSRALRERSAQHFEGTRLRALEQLAERLLRSGQGALVTAELAEAFTAHPLRESLARLLMLALHQDGRAPEALAVYRTVRARLTEEAGVDPGTDLRAALHDVLGTAPVGAGRARGARPAVPVRTAEPAADQPPAAPPIPVGAPRPPAPAPAPASGPPEPATDQPVNQLPREARGFTGRAAELEWLDERAGQAVGPADGPSHSLLAVTGPAGVGKTALVLRWAHRFTGSFPDGRHWVDLRGFDESAPLTPEEALAALLRSLGVARASVPEDLAGRTALYRTVVAERRALIVLENARDAEQVVPLLPGGAGCLTVVTSRERLFELVALEGAAVLPLGLLTAGEGMAVLARVAGRDRLAAEPAAAARVVELCEGLPLALRIAAARLATRPGWPVAALAGELADERSRLAALAVAGSLSIEAALELSCRTLPGPALELFGVLGLHPGQQVDTHAAAALAGTDLRSVRAALTTLDSAHLLQETAPGRYARHDLVRLYSRQLPEPGRSEDPARATGPADAGQPTDPGHLADPGPPPAARTRAARTRLLDYYLAATTAAAATFRAHTRWHQPDAPPTGGVPRFSDPAEALGWFRREEPAIRELVRLAQGWGLGDPGCRLAVNAGLLYYDDGGLLREWEQTVTTALAGAEAAGTADRWADLYADHAGALKEQGRFREALRPAERACLLADRLGDPALAHLTRTRLANLLVADGRPEQAVPHLEATVTAARQLADDRLLGQSLNNLANAWLGLERPAAALPAVRESLRLLAGRTADPFLVISTQSYAEALHGLGRAGEAITWSTRALELGRAQGNHRVEGYCAEFVGDVLAELGRHEQARARWRHALDLATRQGRPTARLSAKLAVGRPRR
ncbi:BTAD domain-containing putative transcriptional regulator [Kitasatospora sp. NPDC093550]|uniref:AfsR/SARP family transcriptional regulator n=1 Tax=Kitasatospora sp. NPDC093550 TaxID=3364089 RepID=UPI003801F540